MKNLILKLLFAGCLMAFVPMTFAQDAEAKILKLENPAQSLGIHIGDVLTRHVDLELKQPYQISKNAFPIKGLSRNGVELRDVTVDSEQHGDHVIYKIALSYQVFGHTPNPSVMSLPVEEFVMTGGPLGLSIKLPAWHFWFSPLVAGSLEVAKENLQPQQQTTLIDVRGHQLRLAGFMAMMVIAVVLLVYMNADGKWLPLMGGAFANAHRKLKQLSKNQASGKQALVCMHEAFNQVHGHNLFARDVDGFLAANPGFIQLKDEIVRFFDHSNQWLFEANTGNDATLLSELVTLSRQLRDCERGLK